jgi:hypothetical protein
MRASRESLPSETVAPLLVECFSTGNWGTESMVDVFISYKRDERARAARIAHRLQALGLEVWYDDKIASGTQFDAEIEGKLREASAILVLWTPGSVKSDWVRNEAAFGLERGNLVAVMLAPCELPVAFRSTQYEPIFPGQLKEDHPGWVKVVERTKDLTNKREIVENQQRRRLIRRKIGRSFQWFGGSLVAAFLLVIGVASVSNAQRQISPQGSYFYDTSWPGDEGLLEDAGYYSFRGAGTWELRSEVVGDRVSSPMNYVQIECRSEWGFCIEAVSEITDYHFLNAWMEQREIQKWDEHSIITRTETDCFIYTLTINRDTEAISALQTVREDIAERYTCNSGLVSASELTRRKEFRLVDGATRELENTIGRQRSTLPLLWGALSVIGLFVAYRIFLVWRARQ